jgi:hypothetical protein
MKGLSGCFKACIPIFLRGGWYEYFSKLIGTIRAGSAEEARRFAANAKIEADQARTYADTMRQSYQSCLSGMKSQ